MSLATRCTECGTVFRVVQDQLKVSEGWVRCGRCGAVFNALEDLCEIDGEEPATTAPASGAADSQGFASTLAEAPAAAVAESELITDAPSYELPDDDTPAAIVTFSSESAPDDAAAPFVPPPPASSAPAPPAPRFVRAADRAAYWRRAPVRAGLSAAAVLLALLLAAQLALAARDTLAAHVPSLRPLLQAACDVAGCRIEPLRRIDRLSVDSSGLTRLEGAALYRLSVVLHNRADTPLAAPALDLSLTDGSGKLITRKVLQAGDLGLPPVIDAGAELPLQALLSTGDRRISGYTVELFYP